MEKCNYTVRSAVPQTTTHSLEYVIYDSILWNLIIN